MSVVQSTHRVTIASLRMRVVRRQLAAPGRCFWTVRRPPCRVQHSPHSPSLVTTGWLCVYIPDFAWWSSIVDVEAARRCCWGLSVLCGGPPNVRRSKSHVANENRMKYTHTLATVLIGEHGRDTCCTSTYPKNKHTHTISKSSHHITTSSSLRRITVATL